HHIETPALTMRPLPDEFIDDYLRAIGDAAFSSPGSYQIEGLGAHLFSSIEGCSYAVLGLPLLQVLAFLRGHGLAMRGQE
ncbi:MAG: Maf family protein, partial [Candidatus Puniceispirillaceae bacterium]